MASGWNLTYRASDETPKPDEVRPPATAFEVPSLLPAPAASDQQPSTLPAPQEPESRTEPVVVIAEKPITLPPAPR